MTARCCHQPSFVVSSPSRSTSAPRYRASNSSCRPQRLLTIRKVEFSLPHHHVHVAVLTRRSQVPDLAVLTSQNNTRPIPHQWCCSRRVPCPRYNSVPHLRGPIGYSSLRATLGPTVASMIRSPVVPVSTQGSGETRKSMMAETLGILRDQLTLHRITV